MEVVVSRYVVGDDTEEWGGGERSELNTKPAYTPVNASSTAFLFALSYALSGLLAAAPQLSAARLRPSRYQAPGYHRERSPPT